MGVPAAVPLLPDGALGSCEASTGKQASLLPFLPLELEGTVARSPEDRESTS